MVNNSKIINNSPQIFKIFKMEGINNEFHNLIQPYSTLMLYCHPYPPKSSLNQINFDLSFFIYENHILILTTKSNPNSVFG